MLIYAILLFAVYIGSTRYLVQKIVNKISKNSLGYVKNIEYKYFNYFTLTFKRITIKCNIEGISLIQIPSLRIIPKWRCIPRISSSRERALARRSGSSFRAKIEGMFAFFSGSLRRSCGASLDDKGLCTSASTIQLYIDILFPDKISIYKEGFIKDIALSPSPILQLRLKRGFWIKLLAPLSMTIAGSENTLLIDDLLIKDFKNSLAKKEILLTYHYINQNEKILQRLKIDLIIEVGRSERSKTKYLKSFGVKEAKIELPSSMIKIVGSLEYLSKENPVGNLVFYIKNPTMLTTDFFSKEQAKLSRRVNDFINLMLTKEYSEKDDLVIKCHYTKNGVEINSIPLCDIRKALKNKA